MSVREEAAGQQHCQSQGRVDSKLGRVRTSQWPLTPRSCSAYLTTTTCRKEWLLLHFCLPRLMPILSLGPCMEEYSRQCSLLTGLAQFNPPQTLCRGSCEECSHHALHGRPFRQMLVSSLRTGTLCHIHLFYPCIQFRGRESRKGWVQLQLHNIRFDHAIR